MKRFSVCGFAIMFGFLGVWSTWIMMAGPVKAETVEVAGRASEGQKVLPEQLRRALMRRFRQDFRSWPVNVTVRMIYPGKALMVPKGALTIQVANRHSHFRAGRRAFRLELRIGPRLVKTVNTVAEVTAQAHVVTPTHWVKPSEVLHRQDVTMETVSLRSLDHEYVFQEREAIGKRAVRPLAPHHPIQAAFLALPPVINKGDRVRIEARQGGLLIQTLGKAKASGELGKAIPVLNQDSGREILGTIVGPGLVKVSF